MKDGKKNRDKGDKEKLSAKPQRFRGKRPILEFNTRQEAMVVCDP